jgi:hypothetical protein
VSTSPGGGPTNSTPAPAARARSRRRRVPTREDPGGGGPAGQQRRSAQCSTTPKRIGGRSNACRVSTPVTGALVSSSPQPLHRSGTCQASSSGSATWARWAPGAPCCLPGRRRSGPGRQPAAAPARACPGSLRTAAGVSSRSPCRAGASARPSASAVRRSAGPARRWTRKSAMTAAWTATVASRSGSGGRDRSLHDNERSSPLAHGPQRHSYTSSHPTVNPDGNTVTGPDPGPEQYREGYRQLLAPVPSGTRNV